MYNNYKIFIKKKSHIWEFSKFEWNTSLTFTVNIFTLTLWVYIWASTARSTSGRLMHWLSHDQVFSSQGNDNQGLDSI